MGALQARQERLTDIPGRLPTGLEHSSILRSLQDMGPWWLREAARQTQAVLPGTRDPAGERYKPPKSPRPPVPAPNPAFGLAIGPAEGPALLAGRSWRGVLAGIRPGCPNRGPAEGPAFCARRSLRGGVGGGDSHGLPRMVGRPSSHARDNQLSRRYASPPKSASYLSTWSVGLPSITKTR